MRRYPAYDPPEYVAWTPEPEVSAEYAARVMGASGERGALLRSAGPELLLRLYRGLLRARLHDIALQRWVKQGVLTKAWLATGEEAVTVGAVHALEADDVVAPMIRNASACLEKGIPLATMFGAYLSAVADPNVGRDLHTGDLRRGVIAPISHVAALVPVVTGAALAFKMDRRDRVALTWVGDGSTRCGEFHEGVNLAAVLRVPAIFVVQNNQVALGTAASTHTRGSMTALGAAYGIPCIEVDGNHVLEVWAATRQARRLAAAGEGPVLMVVETFRMGGHATHDLREARALFDAATFARWGRRDPIGCFERWLVESGPALGAEGSAEARTEANAAVLQAVEASVVEEVDAAAERALAARGALDAAVASVTSGVFAGSF